MALVEVRMWSGEQNPMTDTPARVEQFDTDETVGEDDSVFQLLALGELDLEDQMFFQVELVGLDYPDDDIPDDIPDDDNTE